MSSKNQKTAEEILKEAHPQGGKKLPPQLAKLTYEDLRTLQEAFGTVSAQSTSSKALADCCCCCTAVSVKAPNC